MTREESIEEIIHIVMYEHVDSQEEMVGEVLDKFLAEKLAHAKKLIENQAVPETADNDWWLGVTETRKHALLVLEALRT